MIIDKTGQRIQFADDGCVGTVVDINWGCVKIEWDDGTVGIFELEDPRLVVPG